MNRCDGITTAVRQCRRKPLAGSAYCAQHVEKPIPDLDEACDRAVNSPMVALVAESSGAWDGPGATLETRLAELHDALLNR